MIAIGGAITRDIFDAYAGPGIEAHSRAGHRTADLPSAGSIFTASNVFA